MSDQGFLGERRLRLAELGAPVRRIIFTTYAVLLGLAGAVAVRDRFAGPEIPTLGGYIFRANVMYIGIATSAVALAMLGAGAAHARTRWRYLLVTPILLAIVGCMVAGPATEVVYPFLPVPFLIAVLFVVGIGRRLTPIATLIACLAIAAAFVVSLVVVSLVTRTAYGPTAFLIVIGVASVALVPALLVIGFDLSEIGSGSAALLVRRLEDTPRPAHVARLCLLGVGLATAIGVYLSMGYRSETGLSRLLLWSVLIGLAAIVAARVMLRRAVPTSGSHVELGYLQVLSLSIIVVVCTGAGMFFTEPTPNFLTFGGIRPFSFMAPSGMQKTSSYIPSRMHDPNWAFVRFTTDRRPPTLAIVGVPHASLHIRAKPPSDLNELIGVGDRVLSKMPLTTGKSDRDGWSWGQQRSLSAKGHAFQFYLFKWENRLPVIRPISETTWYIVCGGGAEQRNQVEAICLQARSTFSTGRFTAQAYRSSRSAAIVLSVVFLAAAAGALVLATRRSKRGDTPMLDFAMWVLLLTGARLTAGYLFGGVEDPLQDLKVGAELLAALVAVMTLAATVATVWPASRAQTFDLSGSRRLASESLAGAIVIAGLYFLYVFAVGEGERSQAIRGVVIVLALTWELATAGTTLNPAGEEHVFPRASRVLIFVGYLILVATCVFTLGQARMTSGVIVGAFDTEEIVASGLVTLGGALVISRAVRGLIGLRRAQSSATTTDWCIPAGSPATLPGGTPFSAGRLRD